MLNEKRQRDREFITTHPSPEQHAIDIDIENLIDYETQVLVDAVRMDSVLGVRVIWQMLRAENKNYRSDAQNPNGKNPKIESKILAVIAHDLASAVDFDGNPVRTKETQEELAKTIKVSEITELLIELEKWFDEKTRKKVVEEITTLSESISIMEKSRLAQIRLLSMVSLENPDQDTLLFISEINDLSNKLTEQSEKLEALIKSKQDTEYKLVSEIVDLFYNLIQLQNIDYKNSEVYGDWIREICNTLGWNFSDALALTIAKYHDRNYKREGKNDFTGEYKQIGRIISLTDEQVGEEIAFPNNKQLKKLYNSLEDMVRYGTTKGESACAKTS